MSPAWFQEFWRLFSLVLLFFLIGLLTEEICFYLFIVALIYISWHLYNLYRLHRWFTRNQFQLPDAPGIWGEVFHQFYRLQQRNRKRKRKLAAILKRFQKSTAAMPDATIVLSKNYQIEWINKAARQLLGLKSPQDRGKDITNFIRSPNFAEYLANNNNQSSVNLVSPSDSTIMLRICVVPYARNDQYLLLARNITPIHRLEQMRSDFIANVSHELRTPLTVINGFIENLQDGNPPKQWERPLVLMAQQTIRMRNLVEDLLLLSRLESETAKPSHYPVAVAELLKTICEEAQMLGEHEISLEVDKKLKLNGQQEELRSAFSNLIFNAIRYTPIGGSIKIYWYKDKEGKHFKISDTGEGIEEEHFPRLTERFYRVDVARSRNRGGTGLGLAIVKHVLNRHQGKLRIKSKIGIGSTFWCDFSN
jgi:two-component system phosphate regulon sensor histidine kinase PhoR